MSMDYYERLQGYEADKKALPVLPPAEYEKRIKELVEKWQI